MSVVKSYLEKHAVYPQVIKSEVPSDLALIVVVHVYSELNYLPGLLKSLNLAALPSGSVEIIFVINEHENSDAEILEESRLSKILIENFKTIDRLFFHVIHLTNLKSKIAGVGHARKAGMDEAARRFDRIQEDGIIACLDADCVVQLNYFKSILDGFDHHPTMDACSLYFEHDVEGINAPAIIAYELHLRYFIDIQRTINLPYAYQTIGSSMAVRTSAYSKMGGMNQRKAGEDFYFLHKFIAVDKLFENNTTTVIPSSRESSRVPFGTGKAVKDINASQSVFYSYNSKSFLTIEAFCSSVETYLTEGKKSTYQTGDLNPALAEYLISEKLMSKLDEIQGNTSNALGSIKRFYQWFNAFRLMKTLHYLRDHQFENVPISSQARDYILDVYNEKCESDIECLNFFRRRTKANNYFSVKPL